jgi:glyoxylase-like metal-dependent hydrolase (beta-lactamase superfamily II)
MKTWRVGDVTVTKVYESMLQNETILHALDIAPADLEPYRSWMAPYLGPNDEMLMSVHAFCIEAGNHRIVVDTCIGNDRDYQSPEMSKIFNGLRTTLLDDLAAAGFGRDDVDTVICTHLHPDHIGYNTICIDGVWEPTFRSARYIISSRDHDLWQGDALRTGPLGPVFLKSYQCSIEPLVLAGLADLIDPCGFRISSRVSLVPTPGHTPDHFSVMIESQGHTAIITGDSVHSPLQLTRPEWSYVYDVDRQQSAKSRRRLIALARSHDALVLGTHFPGQTGGYLKLIDTQLLFQ